MSTNQRLKWWWLMLWKLWSGARSTKSGRSEEFQGQSALLEPFPYHFPQLFSSPIHTQIWWEQCLSSWWISQPSRLGYSDTKMGDERMRLSWNKFAETTMATFRNLGSTKDFSDVTLVGEDSCEVKAHRAIRWGGDRAGEPQKLLENCKWPENCGTDQIGK